MMRAESVVRLARWGLSKHVLRQKYLRTRVQQFEMVLDLRVPGVSRALAIHGEREADKAAIMRRELAPGMTHVDLGANIGYYALLAAHGVGSSGRVIAIEPDPRNVALLRQNVALNNLDGRIEIVEAAMADRSGTATMYQASASNLNTLVQPGARPRGASEHPMDVRTLTLDELLSAHGGRLNFLRMDIEGFEVEALSGGMRSLAASPPPCKILLETHPQMYGPTRDFGAVLRKLYAIGFVPTGLVSAGSAQPEALARLGYQPDELFHADGFTRGYYRGVTPEHVAVLCMTKPKVVRYLLLNKE